MKQDFKSGSRWQAYALLVVWAAVWVLAGLLGRIFYVLSLLEGGDNSRMLLWPGIGIFIGTAVSLLQRHPRRALALIPIGAFGLTIVLGLLRLGVGATPALAILAGAMLGLMLVPLLRAYLMVCPRHWFYAMLFAFVWFAVAPPVTWAIDAFVWSNDEQWARSVVLPTLIGTTTLGFAVATWLLFRELLEFALEMLIWPIYRVKGYGPGLSKMPRRGPALVVANHSAWFDPMWLAKVLPRRLIPMMTSVFYDLPVIHWLMIHAAHAIRVQASGFRRDVPELKEAIAALDRGECLVVFPEGYMRRKEEQPLRQFGQGVWHILKERPETPVVACWIEGGWGCYFSYRNGPPTKNKKFDFWRRIEVGVSPPAVIDPVLLSEHRALRTHLMKACLEARRHLGKEPYALAERVEEEAPDPGGV